MPFLDEMRGFLILYVVAYHTLYDLAVLFPVGIEAWFFSPTVNTLRDILTGGLIVISGVSCLYSRSNIRRGAKTLLFALLLTLATWLFMRDQIILFGVLHCLGLSMLLYGLLERPLAKIPAGLGFAVFFALAALTWHLNDGTFGIFNIVDLAPVPAALCGHRALFFLGLPCAGVYSADYFPLLPWFCLFLAGAFAGRPLRAGTAPEFFYESKAPLLAKIGRHTLVIYLAHQPIVYGILYLVFTLKNH